MQLPKRSSLGFTLAELLITLAILGVIATFAIPKVITAQSNAKKQAVAKELMAALANVVNQAKLNSTLTMSTTMGDLTPSLNYVAVDTASSVDSVPNGTGVVPCSTVGYHCLRFHSGAILLYDNNSFQVLGGGLAVVIDPDGVLTSQQDSLGVMLDTSGRVETYGEALGSTTYTPTWFNW